MVASGSLLEIVAVFGRHCLLNTSVPFGVAAMGGAVRVGTDTPTSVAPHADLAALNADRSVGIHVYIDAAFVEGSIGNQSIVLLSSADKRTEVSIYGCAADSVDTWSLRNVSTSAMLPRTKGPSTSY